MDDYKTEGVQKIHSRTMRRRLIPTQVEFFDKHLYTTAKFSEKLMLWKNRKVTPTLTEIKADVNLNFPQLTFLLLKVVIISMFNLTLI